MIRIEDLTKIYDRRTKHANRVLHDLSLTLPDTGFVCILGASGCGKTSLLNAIGGLDRFDSGRIVTDTAVITRSPSRAMEIERNTNFGYIFQNYYLLSDHSVAYNVFLGMHSMPLSRREKMARVREALEQVDMLRYRKRPVGQLSGGQQQRVAIARAIARSPGVIFADEPTGNLDEANTVNICTILKELSQKSLVVMVTHEERIARFFADRIITLDEGRIVSDTTDWSRGTMDAGEKDALYAAEYDENRTEVDGLSLRLLSAPGAAPVSLTLIAEQDRIILKVDDPRVVLCSEPGASPRLVEGARPVLDVGRFAPHDRSASPPASDKPKQEGRGGLGLRFLLREARFLVSGKRLGRIGTGIFIVLLSLMIAMSVSDIITVAHIDPEDFITTDSHVLDLTFRRGPSLPANVWELDEYKEMYMDYLDASDLDFDYLMQTGNFFEYVDTTVAQFGAQSLRLTGSNYVGLDRLDASTLIHGRMPERYDEVVIDRWLLDKKLSEEGIIQNIIPDASYLIGKQLTVGKKSFSPTVVGICDSGEPVIYMSHEAMLSIGAGGAEVISFSEFCTLTGYAALATLPPDACIALTDTAGAIYAGYVGQVQNVTKQVPLTIADAVSGTRELISAKFVVADETVERLYRDMIGYNDRFSLWCDDKEAMLSMMEDGLPSTLTGLIDLEVEDKYAADYEAYREQTLAAVDARTIVTATVLLLSLVMLYLMQRSKINERMDLVNVYRLLGIPKWNLMLIFAAESVALTLIYAVPTVCLVWLGVAITAAIDALGFVMLFPIWAAGITLLAILVIRLLLAVVPVLRLLSQPPAVLASKFDF